MSNALELAFGYKKGGILKVASKLKKASKAHASQAQTLEKIAKMNKGGGAGNINISLSGNVLTRDFVEGELAESIKEAVRKGSDFGLS